MVQFIWFIHSIIYSFNQLNKIEFIEFIEWVLNGSIYLIYSFNHLFIQSIK